MKEVVVGSSGSESFKHDDDIERMDKEWLTVRTVFKLIFILNSHANQYLMKKERE